MIIKEKEQITGDFIDDAVLRSVDDLEHHLRPEYRDSFGFQNGSDETSKIFSDAHALFYKHLLNADSKIINTVDDDVDGIMSTSLLMKFMQELNCPIDLYIGKGKSHGFTKDAMEKIKNGGYTLVIATDSGSNDTEQHKELVELGIDVLVIDHHEVSEENVATIKNYDPEHCVVLNNQLLDFNKQYTGVGMTYQFLQSCNYYENMDLDLDKYLDIVALGQVADVSDVSNPEIRYYVYKGLNNIVNPFIKAVMEHKSLDVLTGRDASFSIISMCNAVARIGTVEEKKNLINAFTQDTNETVTITKKKKNKFTGKFDKIEEEVSIYTNMVLECEKIKRRQDKMVKDAMNNIETLQDEVVVLVHSQGTPTAINGLIAMKLADKYKKPVLVTNNIYGDNIKGSARCPYDFDFKQYLLDSYLMNYAQGHAQAFGWSISIDDFEGLQQYFNMHPIDHDPIHYVDKVFTKPEESDIIRVEVNKHIYGGKVEYAVFAYTGVSFNKFCINKRGSMLTLFDNGVTFVMFNATDKLYEELLSNMKNNFVSVDIVGEPRLSSFTGKTRAEVIIKDIEITEECENEFGIDF
ncbi:hypothetical protein [Staphylococcus phage PT1-1]